MVPLKRKFANLVDQFDFKTPDKKKKKKKKKVFKGLLLLLCIGIALLLYIFTTKNSQHCQGWEIGWSNMFWFYLNLPPPKIVHMEPCSTA